MGNSAREVVDMSSISGIDGIVIRAVDSSFGLLAEIGVLEGVNVQ